MCFCQWPREDVATCASLASLSECVLARNNLWRTGTACAVPEHQVPVSEPPAILLSLPKMNPTIPLFCVLGKSCWNQWICHPETCFRIGLFPLPACFLVYFTSSISLWISCSYIKKEISLQVTLVNSYPHTAIFSGLKAHSAFCYLTSCENDAWVPGCWYRTLIDRAVFNLIKRLFLWWWAAAFAASQNGMSLACCS